MKSYIGTLILLSCIGIYACGQETQVKQEQTNNSTMTKIEKSDSEWKKELDPEVYYVTREKGTERAFTGKYYEHHEDGVYMCSNCSLPLFDSEHKYESGSGWPSFYTVVDKNAVGEIKDKSHGMIRTEVVCERCGAHLGHLFNDGPQPTGMRYCINSASLKFEKEK